MTPDRAHRAELPTLRNSDAYITIHISEGGQADYDHYRGQYEIEYSFRDIAGLGDAAHAFTTGAVVLTGDYVTYYNLQLYNFDDVIQQERVIELARAGTATIRR